MNDASNESPLSPSGVQQIFLPRREIICTFKGGAGSDEDQDVFFRVRIPDSRLHIKLTLRASSFESAPGAVVLAGRGLTLWLYAAEADQMRGHRFEPVTDLAGSTSAAPINLPANSALGGFSREFVTSADAVEGRVRIPAQAPGGTQGDLVLQARYQPNEFRYIPDREWDQIKSLCRIELLSPAVVVP